jgi:nucleoside-diphosphate-sugar epimerase
MRIFLAGASGVIGQRLLPLLLGAGYQVTGTTRSAENAARLRSAGVTPAVVDVFDALALRQAMMAAAPDVVIQQLTDLPRVLDPAAMAAALSRNARLRQEGTRNLVTAMRAAGARRIVAQSIAWVYAAGTPPYRESDALDREATGDLRVTIDGVIALEALVGGSGLHGIVMRYGRLYGPGTWSATPPDAPALHVDAAAHAAFLAVERGEPGHYNIAEDDSAVTCAKARERLGFDPAFRLPL